jgi:hypothetical protein
MLASTLGVVGFIAIVLLALGVVNPIIPIVVIALAAIPLLLLAVGRLFRHAAPTPGGGLRTAGAPAPSTREASYQPIEDPKAR